MFIYKYVRKYRQTDDASSSNISNGNEGNNVKLTPTSYIDSSIKRSIEESQKSNNPTKIIPSPDCCQLDHICTPSEMGEIVHRINKIERNVDLLVRVVGIDLESDTSNKETLCCRRKV